MKSRLCALAVAVALGLASLPARAGLEIDTSAAVPVPLPPRKAAPLPQPSMPMGNTVIILEPETSSRTIVVAPSCINCGTLRSNQQNVARSLSRARIFQQDVFDSSRSVIFIPY